MHFPNSSTTFRTLFQVSGCDQRPCFIAASEIFTYFISTPVSLPRCSLPFIPLSLPLPPVLSTRKPKSCGVTLTSFLAPISHLMTQRQFSGSPSAFHVRKFPTQIGWCFGTAAGRGHLLFTISFTSASFVRLVRTTTVQPHNLAAPGRTFTSPRN